MPRLKGNSSHGSKPMTTLSLTLSWMPHCWLQKQQWVLTSVSGSTSVARRSPVMRAQCGPNCRVILTSSTGTVAIRLHPFRSRCPEPSLCQPEQRPPAFGADLLVMRRRTRRARLIPKLVPEPQLPLHLSQVSHHHRRRELAAAAGALRLLGSRPHVLVEAHPELRRPLEDVEE